MAAIPTPEYYVFPASFEAETGEDIPAGSNPTVTLSIEPAPGYTVTAGNFSIGEVLPSEIDSVVFSQNGLNVSALVTFATGFTMPSADVELLIDIDGNADERTFTIDGEYTISQTNTQESATTPVAFSQSGVDDATVTLFTKTFTADSGYYYITPPYYYQTRSAKREDDTYIITYSDTFIAGPTPSDSLLTARAYTVKYTIDGQDKTLNDLNFVANAEQLIADATEVTSYSISFAKIQSAGGYRAITFFGSPGADVTIAQTAPYPVDQNVIDNNNVTLQIPSAGFIVYYLFFPTNTTGFNQTWSFTLTGDLHSPFTQDNPFSIIQSL